MRFFVCKLSDSKRVRTVIATCDDVHKPDTRIYTIGIMIPSCRCLIISCRVIFILISLKIVQRCAGFPAGWRFYSRFSWNTIHIVQIRDQRSYHKHKVLSRARYPRNHDLETCTFLMRRLQNYKSSTSPFQAHTHAPNARPYILKNSLLPVRISIHGQSSRSEFLLITIHRHLFRESADGVVYGPRSGKTGEDQISV